MVSFAVSSIDKYLIGKVMDRVRKIDTDRKMELLELEMSLTACHANGCPLNLKELIRADDFTVLHDVLGIDKHIDKSTGELRNCFMPRCSA